MRWFKNWFHKEVLEELQEIDRKVSQILKLVWEQSRHKNITAFMAKVDKPIKQ